jgi:hypothetical protein
MSTALETPIISRERISNQMSYPIGYEFLKEHFGFIAQWRDASFNFRARPTTFASEFMHLIALQQPYPILRLERCPSSTVPAHWAFTVFPVQRSLKIAARSHLASASSIDTLIAFVSRTPTHPHAYNRCEVVFDPASQTCAASILYALS